MDSSNKLEIDLIDNVDDGKEKRERCIDDKNLHSRSALMKINNYKGCGMIRKKSRKCEKCGKILASQQSLWRQKQRHLSEKSRKCEKCGKILASRQSLWKHKQIHFSENSK